VAFNGSVKYFLLSSLGKIQTDRGRRGHRGTKQSTVTNRGDNRPDTGKHGNNQFRSGGGFWGPERRAD